MQTRVRVVRMLIDCPLSGLARGPLIVELVGDPDPALVYTPHTSLHIRKALPLVLELFDHALALIPELLHLRRERANLVRHDPDCLDCPIEIVPHVRIVVVFYLFISALRRITGLRRSR